MCFRIGVLHITLAHRKHKIRTGSTKNEWFPDLLHFLPLEGWEETQIRFQKSLLYFCEGLSGSLKLNNQKEVSWLSICFIFTVFFPLLAQVKVILYIHIENLTFEVFSHLFSHKSYLCYSFHGIILTLKGTLGEFFFLLLVTLGNNLASLSSLIDEKLNKTWEWTCLVHLWKTNARRMAGTHRSWVSSLLHKPLSHNAFIPGII